MKFCLSSECEASWIAELAVWNSDSLLMKLLCKPSHECIYSSDWNNCIFLRSEFVWFVFELLLLVKLFCWMYCFRRTLEDKGILSSFLEAYCSFISWIFMLFFSRDLRFWFYRQDTVFGAYGILIWLILFLLASYYAI